MDVRNSVLALILITSNLLIVSGRSKLVCFGELWANGRPSPADYDFQKNLPSNTCDYLILTFLTLDAKDWTLKLHTGYGELDPEDLHDAVKAREKNPEMKILIAVGGWEDGAAKYSQMMSESSSRNAFVQSAVNTLDTYKLDGMDLHWMYPGATWRGAKAGDKQNFVQLIKELNQAFKRGNWIVTASVPPEAGNMRAGYNVPRLNSLLHQMHIRTQDMRGDWGGFAAGHSPLYSGPRDKGDLRKLNVNDTIHLWLEAGASPRKIIPIFPFYGRSFRLRDQSRTDPGSPTAGPGQESQFIRAPGIMAYFEICEAIQNKDMTEGYENGAETPYAYQDDLWVGFENEYSIQKKVKLVSEKQLTGVAVFALGLDDFTGKCGQSNFLLHKTRGFLAEINEDPDPRDRSM